MTDTAPLNFANRYAHIDALRAASVMLVVVHHLAWGAIPGPAGVTVFFCVSGFIITHLCIREYERDGGFRLGQFYLRRALKLAPPFVLAILVPTVVYGLVASVNWGTVLAQTFFVYNWVQVVDFPAALEVLPGSEVVWSLAVEEQFYIAFAILWLVLVRRPRALRWLAIAAVVAIVYATALRFALVDADAIRVARATDTRMDSVAWGVLAAVAFALARRGRLALDWIGRAWAPFLAAGLFAVSLVLPDPWGRGLSYTLQCVATALVILWGLFARPSRTRSAIFRVSEWRPVAVIGLASYSIYLVHHVLWFALEPALASLPHWAASAIAIAVGVGVGVAIWAAVERPVLRARPAIERRILGASRTAAAVNRR